jgi:hypothetical protein
MESAGAMHVRMQQSGYTKFPCFLCLWDSRAKSDHWIKTDWPEREDLTVGKNSIFQTKVRKWFLADRRQRL